MSTFVADALQIIASQKPECRSPYVDELPTLNLCNLFLAVTPFLLNTEFYLAPNIISFELPARLWIFVLDETSIF